MLADTGSPDLGVQFTLADTRSPEIGVQLMLADTGSPHLGVQFTLADTGSPHLGVQFMLADTGSPDLGVQFMLADTGSPDLGVQLMLADTGSLDLGVQFTLADTGSPHLGVQFRLADTGSPHLGVQFMLADTGSPDLGVQFMLADTGSPDLGVQLMLADTGSLDLGVQLMLADTGSPYLGVQFRLADTGSPDLGVQFMLADTGSPDLGVQFRLADTGSPDLGVQLMLADTGSLDLGVQFTLADTGSPDLGVQLMLADTGSLDLGVQFTLADTGSPDLGVQLMLADTGSLDLGVQFTLADTGSPDLGVQLMLADTGSPDLGVQFTLADTGSPDLGVQLMLADTGSPHLGVQFMLADTGSPDLGVQLMLADTGSLDLGVQFTLADTGSPDLGVQFMLADTGSPDLGVQLMLADTGSLDLGVQFTLADTGSPHLGVQFMLADTGSPDLGVQFMLADTGSPDLGVQLMLADTGSLDLGVQFMLADTGSPHLGVQFTLADTGSPHLGVQLMLADTGSLDLGVQFMLVDTGSPDLGVQLMLADTGSLDLGVQFMLVDTGSPDLGVQLMLADTGSPDLGVQFMLADTGSPDLGVQLMLADTGSLDLGVQFTLADTGSPDLGVQFMLADTGSPDLGVQLMLAVTGSLDLGFQLMLADTGSPDLGVQFMLADTGSLDLGVQFTLADTGSPDLGVQFTLADTGSPDLGVQFTLADTGSPDLGVQFMLADTGSPDLGVQFMLADTGSPDLGVQFMLADTGSPDLGVQLMLADTGSPDLGVQFMLADTGSPDLGVQFMLADTGSPDLGVQFMLADTGSPDLGVQLMLADTGSPDLGVQFMLADTGSSHLGVQFMLADTGSPDLGVQFMLADTGSPDLGVQLMLADTGSPDLGVQFMLADTGSPDLGVQLILADTGSPDLGVQFMLADTGSPDLGVQFMLADTGSLDLGVQFMLADTGSPDLGVQFMLADTGSPHLGVQLMLADTGSPHLGVQFMLADTGSPDLGVQLMLADTGSPDLGVQLTLADTGSPDLGVQFMLADTGSPDLGVQLMLADTGSPDLGVQFMLADTGSPHLGVQFMLADTGSPDLGVQFMLADTGSPDLGVQFMLADTGSLDLGVQFMLADTGSPDLGVQFTLADTGSPDLGVQLMVADTGSPDLGVQFTLADTGSPDLGVQFMLADTGSPNLGVQFMLADTGSPNLGVQLMLADTGSPDLGVQFMLADTGSPDLGVQFMLADTGSPNLGVQLILADTGSPDLGLQLMLADTGSPDLGVQLMLADTGSPDLGVQFKLADTGSPHLGLQLMLADTGSPHLGVQLMLADTGSPDLGQRSRVTGATGQRGRVTGATDQRRRVTGATDQRRRVTGATDQRRHVTGATDQRRRVTGAIDQRRRVTGATDQRRRVTGATDQRRRLTGATDQRRRVTGAIDQRRRVTGATDQRRRVTGATDQRRRVTGITDQRRRVTGATDQRRRVTGATDQRRRVTGATDQRRRVTGATDQRRRVTGAIDQRRRVTGAPDQRRRVTGATDQRRRVTGATDQRRRLTGATDQRRRVTGAIDQRRRVTGATDQRRRVTGATDQRRRVTGATDQRRRLTGATDQRRRLSGATDQRRRLTGATDQRRRLTGATDQRRRVTGATDQAESRVCHRSYGPTVLRRPVTGSGFVEPRATLRMAPPTTTIPPKKDFERLRDHAAALPLDIEVRERDSAAALPLDAEVRERDRAAALPLDTEVRERDRAAALPLDTEVRERDRAAALPLDTEVRERDRAAALPLDTEVRERDRAAALPLDLEKNEWLCLNCQTQRLLEGSLGDTPSPLLPPSKQGSPRHQPGVTPTASPKHHPGALSAASPRHQPAPSQTASPHHQKTGPAYSASPQHQTGTASSQQQRSGPETAPDKRSSQANHLRGTEQGKAPSLTEDRKPPEEIKQPRAPAESQKLIKQMVPKGKSVGGKKEVVTRNGKSSSEIQKEQEDISKPYSHDLSRSPQSLSDTGYSSDGISSSQSEIAGLVQQEEEKLNGTGISQRSPPSPSELTKLESSVRPLLESKGSSQGDNGKTFHGSREDQKQKQRPRSLSITPEAFDSDEELEDILEEDEDSLEWENQRDQRECVESSDDFGSKLRHDYVEDSSEGFSPLPTRQPKGNFTDEEFMRRQLLEMSAEEDNLEDEDEQYNHVKYSSSKNGQKTDSDKAKGTSTSKRNLGYNSSNMYDENRKDLEAEEEEDVSALQGGLRRFKTIELNSTNNYNRDMDLDHEADISLDREPELEMESLTGSPEERSRGEYSSTLPATTPSYTSGTSPTSMSSLEEDSDSSPSRRQRLEEVKQQRKARHRSHGPLLPTIEDSSEEEELREEEELLREQEKMREVEQQRIRSTARKTKRDKEELRAQRRRERSKTPPSNLSPIEDASPTEEMRQAAEMEELHRSSCSEYSPSIDSEAEGFEIIASKLYKSGSEYNLPTFMSLYSPTEKTSTSASNKPLKSAEEVYEEMMRKAEMFQKQQQSQQNLIYGNNYQQVGYVGTERQNNFEYQYIDDYGYDNSRTGSSQNDYQMDLSTPGTVYDEILQTSQNISRMHQSSSIDLSVEEDKKADVHTDKQFLNAENAYNEMMKQACGPLTPGTSPTQLSAPVSFASSESRVIPDVRVTQHFSKDGVDQTKLHSSSTVPSSKTVTSSYQYGKVSTAATSNTNTDGTPALPSHRSYGQTRGTSDYISNEEQYRNRRNADLNTSMRDQAQTMGTNVSLTSKVISFFKSTSPPLSPTSPTQSPTHSSPRINMSIGNKHTAEFSSQTQGVQRPDSSAASSGLSSPMVAQGTQTPDRTRSPRLSRQQSSQEAPFMVITLASDSSTHTKSKSVSSSTSPVTSPTRLNRQQTIHSYSQTPVSNTQSQQEQMQSNYSKAHTVIERGPASGLHMISSKGQSNAVVDGSCNTYNWASLPPENISLCRISSIPGTSRVEPGPKPSNSAVDLRTAIKSAPVIMTDQGMDLTSLATDTRRYSLTMDQSPTRQSTAVQPLIVNLNAQEQPHAVISTATTVSITVASSMIVSQPKQPMVYGDPFQNRVDFGQGTGSAMCLTQVRHMEQTAQSGMLRGSGTGAPIGKQEEMGGMQKDLFARYNLPSQVTSMVKRDIVSQPTNAQNIANISAMPRQFQQDQGMGFTEAYKGVPEPKVQHAPTNIGGNQPHTMMVQVDGMVPGTVTKLIKEEQAPNALDLTGIKPESQVVCCDVVYKFPFGGSCAGAYNSSKLPEQTPGETAQGVKSGVPYYGQREQEPSDNYQYRESKPMAPPPPQPVVPAQNLYEEQKFYPYGPTGRLHSSMSETNLTDIGLYQPYQGPGGEGAMDLSTMKSSYSMTFTDGNYVGQGLQYGSFTDLRQPTDFFNSSLPMRRFSSMSNIYSDYRYSARDLSNFQESNLAQYSATTAREISRMCAALNSMDQYGGRHTNSPDLLQYGPSSMGTGPVLLHQQGMAPNRQNIMYGPQFSDSRQGFGSLGQYNMPGSRSGAIRQMYPSAATVRAADGMIYSTINTPIASTLPITTQPASVLRPMIRGMYRPYGPGNVTAVPLASLTRVPLVAPRMPLAPQSTYRYPDPSRFSSATSASTSDTPVYLGKPSSTLATSTTTCPDSASTVSSIPISTVVSTSVIASNVRPEASAAVPPDELPVASSGIQTSSKDTSQSQQSSIQKPASESQPTHKAGAEKEEKEKEEERQRKQQEHILQVERERVELEALRQMRLHEELERERLELQRHREKEQMLVQRELQELQSIKHQVLAQQQEERQAQYALQREQLAQQRLQLEQIQQLQQQLQQQLEEQKRQKTTAPPACEQPTRLPPQTVSDIAIEMQRTLAQSGQYWPQINPPFIAMAPTVLEAQGQPRYPGPQRPLTNSASEMSLQTDEQWEVNKGIKKRNSMPRLRDAYNTEDSHEPYIVKKITDSSVQTDDEDGEERFYMARRRRTKRSTDCSVQTDDEDNAEWEQPVRRRRSRYSRHSDSSSDSKHDSKGTSSIAIQTISDCSVQTEPDQLLRVSPCIHITTPDPKVEIVKYISAPEKTHRGESLACQTEPEAQSHGIVVPQISVPTTITPYSSNIQIATSGPLDVNISRQQGTTKFEKKKPDPLEIGYQSHLPADTLSQLVNRQPPKSPQVLYSPVSPLSPHRLLESTFASSERLNKAHVTPQKHFTAESTQRQQILPRPIKTMQRSLSDPKPLSPTSEESAKDRFSLYQQQFLPGGQISAFQSNTLTRKVKRTLPSPPPDEAHLPLTTSQAHSQMYMPNLTQKMTGGQAIQMPKVGFLKTIDHDLKIVEQESTKLRKQQAELEEEEKEIDAKLKYLELGITQRKESFVKDRGGRREFSYLRCLGENRDYMSDSELNNIRMSGYDGNSLLNRSGTAPQYSDFQNTQQFQTSASSYTSNSYQYTAGQTTAPVSAPLQPNRFQQPQYIVSSNGPSQNNFQTQLSNYPAQSSYQTHSTAPATTYQSELGLQNHTGFRPPNSYQVQTTYANQTSLQTSVNSGFQPPDTHTAHQRPRQTSLADLEHKVPTNYEVIGNPTVVISSAMPDTAFSSTTVASNYDQYKAAEVRQAERSNGAESPTNSYSSDSLYTNLEQNIPRNYVMIEDISELTKENPSSSESQKVEPLPQAVHQNNNVRHMKEKNGHMESDHSSKPCCYSRAEEESEEDVYDHHSSDYKGKSTYQHSNDNNGRDSMSGSYYYGDNDSRHSTRLDKHGSSVGMQKHSSKNLAPAVVSSKRNKHRKQGMEQKISKFSPIEEAKDVESDLAASYPTTTSMGSSSSVSSRAKKLQDEITYGLKKNVYEQQKYYGVSSRDMVEDDDRVYGSGSRSRSASSCALEKGSRDSGSSRSKSYERDTTDRYHKSSSKPSTLTMSQSRGRAPMRSQPSEEESPVSPLGKSVGMSRSSGGPMPQSSVESCPPFCSSHSLPDVQDHSKEVPRSHTYKQEENYMMDDSHCVVSDSEAYHLGQEETDWFDKPREIRSDRSRYYSSHSSAQKKMPVKHTYHDYDEPPDDDMWQHDDYSQPRHSSSKEHRHHGDSGRHSSSSSRHLDEQSRRSSKQHPRDQGRHESRPHSQPSSSLKKAQQSDSRSQSGYPPSSSDYSQQSRQSSSYHHPSEAQKSQRQSQISQQQKPDLQSHHQGSQQARPSQSSQQQQSKQPHPQQQSSRQQQPVEPSQPTSHQSLSHQTPHQAPLHQATNQQSQHQQGSTQPTRTQGQQQQQQQQQQPPPPSGSQGQASSRPQQPGPQGQPALRTQQQQAPQQTAKPPPTVQSSAQPPVLPKVEPTDSSKVAAKPTPQPARGPQTAMQGAPAGAKIGQKPTATPAGAAPGAPGPEGESMFSKILPGGAAEQAGKLTEAVSAFGKKFSSFW
ncbi:protein bassoon [Pseudophryne corroboree]|uniref:protein bassoon n=1 Tax=Pseudophryne corroboree TaxID=495146 RepID=UPI00308161CD